MEKQRARTNEEKALKRQKLLDSAKKMFSEFGFQGTTILMITKDAELSPAAFYLYFKSKVEIYRILSLEGTDILREMIQKALPAKSVNGAARIMVLVSAYFEFFQQERAYYDIITVHHLGQKDFFANMNLVDELEKQSMGLLKILAGILDDGNKTGEFRWVDPWKTAATLWGMMDGVLMMAIRKTTDYIDVSIDLLVEQYLDLCLASLIASPQM